MKLRFLLMHLLIAGGVFLSASFVSKRGDFRKEKLPGVVKINETLYYDQTEIANVHWREYMYWTGHIFGFESEEYISTFPDTLVWIKIDSCLKAYSAYYRDAYC